MAYMTTSKFEKFVAHARQLSLACLVLCTVKGYNDVSGDEIVAGEDTYGGSGRLLSHVTPKAGIAVKLV